MPVTAHPSANATFAVTPSNPIIDSNCTGCNSSGSRGTRVLQLAATLANGSPAAVEWSVSGGDAAAGPGSINSAGQYTPPRYLTADHVDVEVTAALREDPTVRATAVVSLTPGFLQPLTPQNLAVGPNGTATITGDLAEAGGTGSIQFSLAHSPTGSSPGEGSLSAPNCQRSPHAFTSCTVTYTAPATLQGTGNVYVVASAGSSRIQTAVLLNSTGVASNPATHQSLLAAPMQLGSSGGNNSDFDARSNAVGDCCSGTLGALVQDASGRQFLLSNNHVLARSDHANVGDAIVQPGLIDNNCTPNGDGPGTVPVGALTAWLPLRSASTNVDAAIAQVASRTVDPTGSILELGSHQPDGSLASAPLGTSSTGGKGESASLGLRVAKSGRTTGLTCGSVSAVAVDVAVDYYRDCAETRPYLTKTFTNQIAVSGDRFSDSGDSGAVVADTSNAEAVGLLFAGGTDSSGVSQALVNPATEVLNELGSQAGSSSNFTFVGGADHGITCLSYGDSTSASAQSAPVSDAQIEEAQHALSTARGLVNPSTGILGVAVGRSSDRIGQSAVLVYIAQDSQVSVPAEIAGVRTVVIPTTPRLVSQGSAPQSNVANSATLTSAALNQALAVKRQLARRLMQQNPAFFGIGVGQSFDNPREGALIVYVDRNRVPASLPAMIDGVRTRYIFMDRMHVTRSYAVPFASHSHCEAPGANDASPVRRSSILPE